jgi:hypothetical protein
VEAAEAAPEQAEQAEAEPEPAVQVKQVVQAGVPARAAGSDRRVGQAEVR